MVALTPLIGDARGKAGDIALYLSRAGLAAKIVSTQIQPETPAQFLQRASLATISQTWKSPPMNAYRAGWIFLAAANPYMDVFGVSHKLTGSAMFTKLNRNLATLGLSIILAAPGSLSCGSPGLLTLSHVPPTPEKFLVTPTTPPASTEAVVIRATKPLSPGIQSLGNTLTVIQTFAAGTSGPWDIFTAYAKKHTTRPPGQLIYVQVNYVETTTGFAGQLSIDSLLW